MENDRTPYKLQVFWAINGQLKTNPRVGVLSKCSKLCISSVKVAFFLHRRSKFSSAKGSVSVTTNKNFMEND